MKFTTGLLCVLLSSSVIASPLQVDVNVHVDNEPSTTVGVKDGPNCLLGTSSSSALPRVSLGYEIHQASPLKKDQTFYAFENIPYAHQPVKELRFKAARALTYLDWVDNPELNDGSKSVICPQVQPGWFPFAGDWSAQLFDPRAELDKRFASPIEPKDYRPLPEPTKDQSEECLTLDVFVPKRIYDGENIGLRAVIVSFHGGGFTFGSKTIFGSPAGILEAAGEKGDEGDVIVVSVNYRLGALGWLAGEEFTDGGGFENAGLSDQVAALEWVSQFIMDFGGDPGAVTVLGESAGASSILHHLTAYGSGPGTKPRPKFQRAILQSPAFFPQTSPRQMNDTYHNFLAAAGVINFKQLQSAKTEDIIKANLKTTYYSPYGTFTYGPVVSMFKREKLTYVQSPPSLKIMAGSWFSNVELMIGNNRREGAIFTPPWLRNEQDLAKYMKMIYPAISSEDFDEFAQLYPVPQNYTDLTGKVVDTSERDRFLYAAAAFGDLGVDCTAWLFKKKSSIYNYRYFYRIYPGFHGQDVAATWYPEGDPNLTSPLLNPKLQSERLQRWLTCFAKEGEPSCAKRASELDFKPQSDGAMWIGSGAPVLNLKGEPIADQIYGMSKLPGALPEADVCEFWNSAPYYYDDPEAMRLRALVAQKGWMTEL